jgi:hypothetical protein
MHNNILVHDNTQSLIQQYNIKIHIQKVSKYFTNYNKIKIRQSDHKKMTVYC